MRLLPPVAVYELLSNLPKPRRTLDPNISERAVEAQIERKDKLVDLGLARFVSPREKIGSLWPRSEVIRIALLSNRNAGPTVPSFEAMLEVLKVGSPMLLETLLTNPETHPRLLARVGKSWRTHGRYAVAHILTNLLSEKNPACANIGLRDVSGLSKMRAVWSSDADPARVLPLARHPLTLNDLVSIVQEAEAANRRVRAVGSSWSFPDIALTPDYLVETDQLNHALSTVVPGALNAAGRQLRLVHVEAGMKVLALCNLLDALGLALPTMGGSDGQSIAGVLSTSVHGPDFNRGPIPDLVRAIHIVGPGGVQHWIEPTQGISDPAALLASLGNNVVIHQNDDWFNAALVTVGTLGIVYSVVIETEPQYDIVETISAPGNWAAVRAMLVSGAAFANADRGTQVVIDPGGAHAAFLYQRMTGAPTAPGAYSLLTDPLGLYCTTVLEDALIASPGGAAALAAAVAPLLAVIPFGEVIAVTLGTAVVTGVGLAGILGGILKLVRGSEPGALGDIIASALNKNPALTAQVVTSITQSKIPVGSHRGFAHTIMSGPNPGDCATRGLAIELAFDTVRGDHLAFVDAAMTLLDNAFANEGLALAGWFSLRFVGRSRASLSPQNRCNRSCMAEFTGLRGFDSTPVLLDRLEALGRMHGATSHWGMFRNVTRADIEVAFPDLDNWRRIRWQMTNNGTLNTFDNPFSERVGLSDPPAVNLSFLEILLTPQPLLAIPEPPISLRPR